MRSAVPLITCLTMLYHLTVGCCGHHAHAAEVLPLTHVHVQQGLVHNHDQPSAPVSPVHEDCHESHCHLALPMKVAMPELSLPSLDLMMAVQGRQCLAACHAGESLSDPPPRFSGTRCHLVLQHFLI